MDFEKEYKRKALEPIVNYIESVMASYSKEELEARIKKALPEKESEDERIRKGLIQYLESDRDYQPCQDVSFYNEAISWLERQKEQKPESGNSEKPNNHAEWSEEERVRTRLITLVEAFGQGKYKDEMLAYLGNLQEYIEDIRQYAYNKGIVDAEEKQKEQKPVTIVRIPKFRVGDIIQRVPLEKWDRSKKITSIDEHGYKFNFSHLGDTLSGGAIGFAFEDEYELVEQKPAEWSEEDERMLEVISYKMSQHQGNDDRSLFTPDEVEFIDGMEDKLKSLRPQPKQEGEPMEIKFAGKIYKVYGTKELPGGGVGYIIEDEPGHYDCIIHPEEVLGGGYGIKSHGSPYPTKGTNFSQPHWKPSEKQMEVYKNAIYFLAKHGFKDQNGVLESLYSDLRTL